MITLAYSYYNQESMLPLHKTAWALHPDNVKYILVDDGSPKPLSKFRHKNLSVTRIEKNIPWNMAGARNLAFFVAETSWVLCLDIDHVVSATALKHILSLNLEDPNKVYIFSRKNSCGEIGCKAIVNILMNRQRYLELGGYDEDFSGNYGREETFFWHYLKHSMVKITYCEKIELDWYPQKGATHGFSRDKTANSILFEKKFKDLKNGTYKIGSMIRFSWHRSYSD